MPKQNKKDNRPKIIEEVQNILRSGRGLTYAEYWEKMHLLCSHVFMQHLFMPGMAGRTPDGEWRSFHNSLLNAIERHNMPKGRELVVTPSNEDVTIGYELPLPVPRTGHVEA